MAGLPIHAAAQVIEIDADGAVKTFDGPTATRFDGSTMALRPAAPAHVLRSAHTAPAAAALVAQASAAASLSPQLVEAVAWRESRLHAGVISRAGAVGEMQLMPATARRLGVDPYDSRQNFWGGAIYLRSLVSRYDGNLVYALAAYNAGPKAVEKYGGVPPFKETRDYVAAILDRLSSQTAPMTDANPAR